LLTFLETTDWELQSDRSS